MPRQLYLQFQEKQEIAKRDFYDFNRLLLDSIRFY